MQTENKEKVKRGEIYLHDFGNNSGIGRAKLYEMTNREDCPFVLWIGNRRVIKRKAFDEYIEKVYSV